MLLKNTLSFIKDKESFIENHKLKLVKALFLKGTPESDKTRRNWGNIGNNTEIPVYTKTVNL